MILRSGSKTHKNHYCIDTMLPNTRILDNVQPTKTMLVSELQSRNTTRNGDRLKKRITRHRNASSSSSFSSYTVLMNHLKVILKVHMLVYSCMLNLCEKEGKEFIEIITTLYGDNEELSFRPGTTTDQRYPAFNPLCLLVNCQTICNLPLR